MPESSPPLIVSSPAALHAAVDSAAITPSDTLLLRATKAEATDANGIRIQSLTTGNNAFSNVVNLPANESATLTVAVTGTDSVVTLAASGTRGVLNVQGLRLESVVKGTVANDIAIKLINPGTALASPSVSVTGTEITLNLGTDAGDKASLTNQGIVYNAVTPGSGGNSITVALVNPGTPSASLGVSVSSNAISVNLATDAGTAQVETATGAGTVSGSGNASIVVTGAGITGSPLTIPVAVVATDTPAIWVDKVRVALAATAAITALYSVGGTGSDITITEKVPNGNDGTLNIAIATGTATGITTAATSTNTIAGVAPAIVSTRQQVALAVNASLTARALVTAVDPGTSTVVTAVSATNLTGGGANPVPSTTLRQAQEVLVAETGVTNIVSVFVNDTNPLYKLTAVTMTNLTGGSVKSASTVQAVVNALNANVDFAALCVATCGSVELASGLAQPSAKINIAGGAAGQWSIDSSFTRSLSVNVAGNVSYIPYNSDTVATVAVVAGQVYPIAARAVKVTNTTATGIVGHI